MRALLAAALFLLLSCATQVPGKIETAIVKPKEGARISPFREFRGLWVATVYNIDWPSRPGLPVEELMSEAESILDAAESLNLNAILLQVRPLCDALYESELEPWSSFLSGKQGKSPEGGFDPLEFWIDEAHSRGLRLFAWINPFRAGIPNLKGGYAENSLPVKRPEMVRKLNKGYLWLDPGMMEARNHIKAVVLDIAERYDVEGIIFDDYFYPYSELYEKGEEFPDSTAYDSYLLRGGTGSRENFRRESVTSLIEEVGTDLRERHPELFFGISPFGIWRPRFPESIEGKDSYSESFADSRLWASKGLVDFISPQLYWPIGRIPQSFPVLLSWWEEERAENTFLWPSIQPAYSRLDDTQRSWETVAQVMVERGIGHEMPGVLIYHAKSVLENPGGFVEGLKLGPFSKKAAFPENPRIKRSAFGAPSFDLRREMNRLVLVIKDEGRNFLEYSISWIYGSGTASTVWKNEVHSCTSRELLVPDDFVSGKREGKKIALAGIDRFGSSSDARIENFESLVSGIPSSDDSKE